MLLFQLLLLSQIHAIQAFKHIHSPNIVNMVLTSTPRTSVTLIGAGTQGRRLAFMARITSIIILSFMGSLLTPLSQWSSRGNDVHLVDGQDAQLQASIKAIEDFRQSSSNLNASWGRIITHSPESLREALQAAWLVVEVSNSDITNGQMLTEKCVPEQIELKTKVISELDALAPRDTIIASNSSSYSCSEILKGLNLRNETRFLSAHSCKCSTAGKIPILTQMV